MYVVYGTNSCVYCDRAKELLNKESVDYDVIDVNEDERAQEMFRSRTLRTVPQIFIEDDDGNEVEHIGGFDQLCEHFGHLKQC